MDYGSGNDSLSGAVIAAANGERWGETEGGGGRRREGGGEGHGGKLDGWIGKGGRLQS